MALLEICRHLQLLTAQLNKVGSGESYRVERIWHNLRLDFPLFRDLQTGLFLDGEAYPLEYPQQRGPNVPTLREREFQQRLSAELSELNQIVSRAQSGDFSDVALATADYFKRIEALWGIDGQMTTCDPCNDENFSRTTLLPTRLCRYTNLRTFVRYTLLPTVPSTRDWTTIEITSFFKGLALEADQPGPLWRSLAEMWKETCARIRQGKVSLWLKPKNSSGDVSFIGDGGAPIHKLSPYPTGSRGTLHHVIRELALPGWERPSDRINNLGLVAIEIPSDSVQAYRPTVLDNFGFFSYFFLPSDRNRNAGLTWRLTDCLCFNSPADYNGQSEWTVIVPKQGIPCVREEDNRPMPSFELAGLEFGESHASLFE